MPEGENRPDQESKDSVWSVVSEVIGGLKDRPILLFAFGLIVVLFGAASLAVERFRVLFVAVLIIYVIAVLAWLVSEQARKRPTNSATRLETVASGDIRIRGGRHQGVTVETGKVTVKGSGTGSQETAASGDVQLGGGRLKDSRITTGEVNQDPNQSK